MRFNKIEINNLAALKGKHIIDLADKNLFAITGPTGSGKSTILSAITLALYGELYKRNLIQNDLITLGCYEASVKLSYHHEHKNYLATWSGKLTKKSGELLKIPIFKRTLYESDNLIDKKTEDIIGLGFDEFCQTIILHQGEFSKFLTSTPAEKRKILEKVFKMEQ